jgi:hypothetical protein
MEGHARFSKLKRTFVGGLKLGGVQGEGMMVANIGKQNIRPGVSSRRLIIN